MRERERYADSPPKQIKLSVVAHSRIANHFEKYYQDINANSTMH